MSGPDHTVRSPESDEVRSYILSMLIELAEMADSVQERALAEEIRYLAWPDRPAHQVSGAR